MLEDKSIKDLDPVLRRDWHVVANSEDVADGGVLGATLLGRSLVIWRTNGELSVAKNLCKHRGGSFFDLMGEDRFTAKIIDGNLECPYHGWQYDSGGQCVLFPYDRTQTPPKTAQLEGEYAIEERYGWIWVCLEPTGQTIPEFIIWDDDAYRKIPCPPYPFRSTAQRFMENFQDVPHFPFVHEGYLGTRDRAEMEDYDVALEEDGLHARNIQFWQANPDGTGRGSMSKYHYHVSRPLTARFEKQTADGEIFSILCHITPHSLKESTIWMIMAMNYGFDTPAQEIVDFQTLIANQDIPIVESQRPELVPLDLTAELSMRPDKLSIAYRRWMRDLGVTFGTE
jgi:phenylpropionate dioxygenase-like ring-hydroxylating dioxygenase large terminal subunit